jgi:8-oxo-dGTP diphosphatase
MNEPIHQAAVGVLITDFEDRVLLVSNPYRDALVQVGGMVEPGESPAAAAEREILEEIGLELTVTRLLAALQARAANTTIYLDPTRTLTP